MRIKVYLKENSLTGDKMKRGGGVAENHVKKGAQLCTLITAIITCCSRTVSKLRRL